MAQPLSALLKRSWKLPVDYALPPRCSACGVIVADDHQFCGDCWLKLDRLSPPWCAHCHLPLPDNAVDGDICAPCMTQAPPYGAVHAVSAYDAHSAAIVLQLKYAGRIGRAALIARQLGPLLPPDKDWLLVPVPLHRWRLWRRGYNQARLIAGELARTLDAPLVRDALVRRKPTRMLKGLNPSQRRRALSGAIAVNPARREALAGRAILLVDDVFTTGATAAACARVLRRAGAQSVDVACWARVIPGRDPASGRHG